MLHAATLALLIQAASPQIPALDVRLVTDEADAVVAILRRRQAGRAPTDADWLRLFSSAGYRALARRETSFKRPFSEDRFRAFVLSDSLLARAPQIIATLDAWRHIDVHDAAALALAYLPPGTPLHSTVFFEIKPQGNSFVFDLDGERAIFLYVDPSKGGPQTENTMAHELHHVGITAACPDTGAVRDSAVWRTEQWMTGFGEGYAMLAAAGGPDVDPHALDDSATRARWNHDAGNFNADLARVQAFFFDILDHRIPTDSIAEHGMSFFGIQGPWYTVGWQMAVVVEKTYGRPRLISEMCTPARFLATYDQAVRETHRTAQLATWSDSLFEKLRPH